jgi:hypothetical protein
VVTRAVYTALLGGYEELVEQPVAAESAVRFVCLTDDPQLRSATWEVVVVEPRFPDDLVRSSRRLKILGAAPVDQVDETLWIDNRVQLLSDPASILDAWLRDDDLAVPRHSYRGDVLDEFREVVYLALDDADRVYEQLIHYSRTRPDVLGSVPAWTGMLARRRSPHVDAAMAYWFEEVARYSRRDQLSFSTAIDATSTPCRWVEIDNFDSPLHQWIHPDRVGRARSRIDESFLRAIAPAPAVERDLRARLRELEARAVVASTQLETVREERKDLVQAASDREAEIGRLAAVSLEADALRGEVEALRGSTSWKATAPLRFLTGKLRALR